MLLKGDLRAYGSIRTCNERVIVGNGMSNQLNPRLVLVLVLLGLAEAELMLAPNLSPSRNPVASHSATD